MLNTPKGNRKHIAILGKRNVGKSSFVNAFLGQELSIVSSTPGTTTDPVEKAYELQPFGPVVLIDTAGIDDLGELGVKRIDKTNKVLNQADFGIVLIDTLGLDHFEKNIIQSLKEKNIPWLLVVNKKDLLEKQSIQTFLTDIQTIFKVKTFAASALDGAGIKDIKEATAQALEELNPDPPIIADLVTPPAHVVLVIPIDKEAPKGRLILPQVQTMRELLDADISCTIVKEKELHYTLNNILKEKPKIVVTDSQAFLKVAADTPTDVLMTSFSILFARQKGNLKDYLAGANAIENLQNGDSILIAELCSHAPISEDIGRVKIPRWLKQYKGVEINVDISVGKDYPKDLAKYKLIIQCGGCVVNRALIMNRIKQAKEQNVPITNYGIAIAYLQGILERALKPFPGL